MTDILPARTNPHRSGVNQSLGRPLIITEVLRWMAGNHSQGTARTASQASTLRVVRVRLIQTLMDVDRAGPTELADYLGVSTQRLSQMRHDVATAPTKGIKVGPGRPTIDGLAKETDATTGARANTKARQTELRNKRADAERDRSQALADQWSALADTHLTAEERGTLTLTETLDLVIERSRGTARTTSPVEKASETS